MSSVCSEWLWHTVFSCGLCVEVCLGVGISSGEGSFIEFSFRGPRFGGDCGARIFEAFPRIHPFEDETHNILRLRSFGRLGASNHNHDFAAHLGFMRPVSEFVQGAAQGFFMQFGEFAAYDGTPFAPETRAKSVSVAATRCGDS